PPPPGRGQPRAPRRRDGLQAQEELSHTGRGRLLSFRRRLPDAACDGRVSLTGARPSALRAACRRGPGCPLALNPETARRIRCWGRSLTHRPFTAPFRQGFPMKKLSLLRVLPLVVLAA